MLSLYRRFLFSKMSGNIQKDFFLCHPLACILFSFLYITLTELRASRAYPQDVVSPHALMLKSRLLNEPQNHLDRICSSDSIRFVDYPSFPKNLPTQPLPFWGVVWNGVTGRRQYHSLQGTVEPPWKHLVWPFTESKINHILRLMIRMWNCHGFCMERKERNTMQPFHFLDVDCIENL